MQDWVIVLQGINWTRGMRLDNACKYFDIEHEDLPYTKLWECYKKEDYEPIEKYQLIELCSQRELYYKLLEFAQNKPILDM